MHLVYPPKFDITIFSNFSRAGITVVPREIKDNSYAKYWGVDNLSF